MEYRREGTGGAWRPRPGKAQSNSETDGGSFHLAISLS